jgi:hypothetical protein
MRWSPLLFFVLLCGCPGQLRDYVGPRSSIVSPQLIRYGLGLDQARCVGDRLGGTLRPLQLRLFARAAASVRQGYYEPARLTMRDLAWIATAMDDRAVRLALDSASAACGVAIASREAPPPPAFAAAAPALPRPSTWLNLGAAGSGQSIAIDASTIEQDGSQRSAWFRMTNPGATGPSGDTYLLRIDCAGRTINAKARRRETPGAATLNIDYPDNPLPVEGGTVMEIAFLSLCT